MADKLRTPNAPATGRRYLLFPIPDSVEYIGLMVGALAELTNEWNYEKYGTENPHETAENFSKVLLDMLYYSPPSVGLFIYSARETPQANWLACNGQYEQMADWPELMEVYPTVLQNFPSTGLFVVADCRGRVLVGDGQGSGKQWNFLEFGGEINHTLSVNEMPAHSHTEITSVTAAVNGGLEAPAVVGIPGAGVTGSAGLGGSHNNLQPYGVCHVYLIGRELP